ncbi:hypothetical protein [Streptomyces sp. NPDC090798]|uniref:hypothetical protein n=1 Tax=Streptomyces sp. NPDC090798 TaxID=3365968 RepID=UPI00381939A7
MTELGLPEGNVACLSGLEEVVTETAVVHAAAWKKSSSPFAFPHPARASPISSCNTGCTNYTPRGAPSGGSEMAPSSCMPSCMQRPVEWIPLRMRVQHDETGKTPH